MSSELCLCLLPGLLLHLPLRLVVSVSMFVEFPQLVWSLICSTKAHTDQCSMSALFLHLHCMWVLQDSGVFCSFLYVCMIYALNKCLKFYFCFKKLRFEFYCSCIWWHIEPVNVLTSLVQQMKPFSLTWVFQVSSSSGLKFGRPGRV